MMIWQKEHKYLGVEYDWLASDNDGYMAFFASAGFGPLPSPLLELGDSIFDIIESVAKLPVRGRAEIVLDSGNVFDWIAMAERGFYSYDWDNINKKYRLVARPTIPIKLEGVADKQLIGLALVVRFDFSIPVQEDVIAE